jgi:signal transduction histidine kinase
MGRIEELNFLKENVKISEIIRNLKIEFTDLNIRIQRDAEIYTDKRFILSVFKNIFHNSIHHGQATEIKISCEKVVSRSPLAAFSVGKPKSFIRIESEDNGLGASPNMINFGDEILNPKDGKTNGIGLFLCKKIIEKQGGQMSFKSVVNKGFKTQIILEGKL